MKTSANIALFYPEEKWSALNNRQQLLRSFATHAALLAMFGGLLGLFASDRQCSRTSSYLMLDLSPVVKPASTQPPPSEPTTIDNEGASSVDPQDLASRTPLNIDSSPLPNGKVIPPEITSPSTRKGPSIKEARIEGENILKVEQPNKLSMVAVTDQMASSPKPADIAAGPKQAKIAGATATGQGAPSLGAHKNQTAQPALPPTTDKTSQSLPSTSLAYANVSGASTNRAGLLQEPPVQVVNNESFAELDGRACRAFYRAEQIAPTNKDEAQKLYQSAAKIMVEALPVLVREQGNESNELALALNNTGRCFERLNQDQQAAEYFESSVKMYEKIGKARSAERGVGLVYLADSLIKQGKYKEAESPLKDSLPIYCDVYGNESQLVAVTYQRLANICLQTKRDEEAAGYSKIARRILGQQ